MRVRAWSLLVGIFVTACGALVAIDPYSLQEGADAGRGDGSTGGGDGGPNGDGGPLGDGSSPEDAFVYDAPVPRVDASCSPVTYCCGVLGKNCEDFDDQDASPWLTTTAGQPTIITSFKSGAMFAGQFHKASGETNVSMSFYVTGNSVRVDADLDMSYPSLNVGEGVEVIGLTGMDTNNTPLAVAGFVFLPGGFGFVECVTATLSDTCGWKDVTPSVSFPAHVAASITFAPAAPPGAFSYSVSPFSGGAGPSNSTPLPTSAAQISKVRVRVGVVTNVSNATMDAKIDNIVVQ